MAQAAAVGGGFGATSQLPFFDGGTSAANTTGAMIGPDLFMANSTDVSSSRTSDIWDIATFFAIPDDEYYWGAVVGASLYRGRFVAVTPSFDDLSSGCASGWLNVAVSSSSDPMLPWTRFRIALPDAWTDLVQIGISDDKVVFTTNEWDLDAGQGDCMGSAYEGSRIQVVDWTDLLDGGTLTMRDVTPEPPTSYYSWIPADAVPGTESTAAGTTVHLVGDEYVGEWGHLAYASVTGSARAATAALAGNVDLTVADSVRLLVGPPATIAAFTTGNGFLDERVTSVVWRAGRLWLAANDQCQVDPDPDPHACARYLELDTTVSPPSVVQHPDFLDLDRDTFLPFVGVSRDGTTYFTMSASSALAREPIDQYATYRDLGDPVFGGADEVLFLRGHEAYPHDIWGQIGAIVPDPADGHSVWAIDPSWIGTMGELAFNRMAAYATRLTGDLSGPAGGTFTMDMGSHSADDWIRLTHLALRPVPDSGSPLLWVRYSASSELESSSDGMRLRYAVEWPSASDIWDEFSRAGLGGSTTGTSLTVYVQWRTADGAWSDPVSQTAQIDTEPPVLSSVSRRFGLGTVGSTAPIVLDWAASDSPSGLEKFQLLFGYSDAWYPASARTATVPLVVGVPSQVSVIAEDKAGNDASFDMFGMKVLAKQGSASGLKYYPTWRTSTSSHYLGGSTRYSSTAGATFSYSTVARGVAFVSTKALNRGQVSIWVDGKWAARIDLRSTTTKYRQIVWQRSWATPGAHTIKVKVLGTSGRPRVDADAFLRY